MSSPSARPALCRSPNRPRGRFIVVGGSPGSHENDYACEYDSQMESVKRHILPGRAGAGIQTACYWNESWWCGCYSDVLLETDDPLGSLERHKFTCGIGIARLEGDRFVIARPFKTLTATASDSRARAAAAPAELYGTPAEAEGYTMRAASA